MTKLQACLWSNVTLKGCYVLLYSLLSTAEPQDGKSIFDVFFLNCLSSRFETQVHRCQVPGFRLCMFQMSGARCQMSGSRCQLPGSMCHTPGVRCWGSGSQEPFVRIMDQVPHENVESFHIIIKNVLMEITNLFYHSTEITNLQIHFSPY